MDSPSLLEGKQIDGHTEIEASAITKDEIEAKVVGSPSLLEDEQIDDLIATMNTVIKACAIKEDEIEAELAGG